MGIKIKVILFFFLAAYFAYHLYTLSLNPLPWFDETYFASISRSFAETGNFTPQVSQEVISLKEDYTYGPVFFMLEALSFKTLGFGIFQYRIITFVFGFLTVLATCFFLLLCCHNRKITLLAFTTFLLDPFFNLSMHEGRMDLVAAFFMVLSIVFIIKANRQIHLTPFFLSGLFAVLALLTTPRIGIVVLAMIITQLLYFIKQPSRLHLTFLFWWSLPVVILYFLWTYFAFGGVTELISYYQQIRVTYDEYIGGRGYIPRHEYLLIPLTVLSVSYGIIHKGLPYFNFAVIVSIVSISLFYIVILDWGPYSALILPFYYFLFFYSFTSLHLSWKNVTIYPCLLLLLFNSSYFALKAVHILSETSIRQPPIAYEFIMEHIPPGSKVAGDAQYYYAVTQAGSHYRLFDVFLGLEEREKKLREVYNYDFLIISERSVEKEPELAAYFLQNSKHKEIARLYLPQPSAADLIGRMGLVSNAEKNGYNATIYKRLKTTQ
jgi:hypothetical protein